MSASAISITDLGQVENEIGAGDEEEEEEEKGRTETGRKWAGEEACWISLPQAPHVRQSQPWVLWTWGKQTTEQFKKCFFWLAMTSLYTYQSGICSLCDYYITTTTTTIIIIIIIIIIIVVDYQPHVLVKSPWFSTISPFKKRQRSCYWLRSPLYSDWIPFHSHQIIHENPIKSN